MKKKEMKEIEKTVRNEKIKRELTSLEKGGLIKPEDVVAFAENPKTALHKKFTWDNTEAGYQWRLYEARQLIRAVVIYIPYLKKEHRVYVSLSTDRYKNPGGGYRRVSVVLEDYKKTQQMILDALSEWELFKNKYSAIRELVAGFKAMDFAFSEATKKIKKKK